MNYEKKEVLLMSARDRLAVFSVAALMLSFCWQAASRAQDSNRPADKPAVPPPRDLGPNIDQTRFDRRKGDIPRKPDLHMRRDADRPDFRRGRPAGPYHDGAPDQRRPGPPRDLPHAKVPMGVPKGRLGGDMADPGMPGVGPVDPEMQELDRKDFELGHQCMELSMRYRHAQSEEKEQLKKELTELVDEHFDVRQQRRELQLKRLEEELKRLREAIGRRSDSREQIVSKRIAELLGEEDNLSF